MILAVIALAMSAACYNAAIPDAQVTPDYVGVVQRVPQSLQAWRAWVGAGGVRPLTRYPCGNSSACFLAASTNAKTRGCG